MSDSAAPRVGIVIRTKDRPLFVVRALRSVLDQTHRDWRVVLVNDGGDKAALSAAIAAADLAAMFRDGRAARIDNVTSAGRSVAFNQGARSLETEFVCCLDDDDTWAPDFLETLLAFHDRVLPLAPDLGGVASLVSAVREDIVTRDGKETLVTLGEDQLPHAFRRTDFFLNPIAYATYRQDLYPVQWMLNREHTLAAGGFPPDFNVMEDRAFMTLFLQRWRVAVLDEALAFHHRRVSRSGDTARSVVMNTLDNPSYDWRLYSDLAKVAVHTPPDADPTTPATAAQTGALLRAAAATVIKELNDETSALWHKINGEAMGLRAQIEALEARVGAVAAPEAPQNDPARRVWSVWDAVGDRDRGYPLAAATPFLDRMLLSMPQDQDGLLMHALPDQKRMVIQIPQTGSFCALEIALDGLAEPPAGLDLEMVVTSPEGFAFETALSLNRRDRLGRRSQRFEDRHIHSCPPGGWSRVTRSLSGEWLAEDSGARLSIILPRHANNFRLTLRDLTLSRP